MEADLQLAAAASAPDLHLGLQAPGQLLLGRRGVDLDLPWVTLGALARRRRQLLELASGELVADRPLGEGDLLVRASQRQQRTRPAGPPPAGAPPAPYPGRQQLHARRLVAPLPPPPPPHPDT